MAQRVPWARITAEGVAIVTSILLAFAIDAAWDASRERAAERQVLDGLREEFSDNQRLLASNIEGHRRTLAACAALLAIADGEAPPPADSMALLLRRTFIDANSFNPSIGVLKSLIASGDIGLIQDAELRGLLASWPSQLEENAEDEAWVFKDVQESYTPFLNRTVAARAIWAGSDEGHPDYAVVVDDPDFQELVAMRAYGAEILIDENEALGDLLARIVDALARS